MKQYHKPGLTGKGGALPLSSLPLFFWAANAAGEPPAPPPPPPPSPPRATLALARTARLPLHIAAVFAVNHNLGGHEAW